MFKTVAVIPCHNEKKTIRRLVESSLNYVDMVIVVDDGSRDDTYIEAIKGGAKVIRTDNNYGYGNAIYSGIKSVLWADVVVTLDGDGQHEPMDIPCLIDAIEDDNDIVIGSRFLTEGSVEGIKLYRRLGIEAINLAFNFGHNRITDSQSGFRAFSKKFVSWIEVEEKGFGMTTELLIKARKEGFKIYEVPVSCTYHNLKQDSHLNPLRHGMDVLFKTLYWRLRVCN